MAERNAEKPLSSQETIPAELHRAVMELPEEDRRDRVRVNEAYRRAMETEIIWRLLGSRERDYAVTQANSARTAPRQSSATYSTTSPTSNGFSHRFICRNRAGSISAAYPVMKQNGTSFRTNSSATVGIRTEDSERAVRHLRNAQTVQAHARDYFNVDMAQRGAAARRRGSVR